MSQCACGADVRQVAPGKRPAKVCETCHKKRMANYKKLARAQYAKNVKLRPGEASAAHMASSVKSLAVMTQEEAVVHLGLWEAMEALANLERLVDTEGVSDEALEAAILSIPRRLPLRQTIQQLERKAFIKLAKALKKEYMDWKETSDVAPTREFVLSPA